MSVIDFCEALQKRRRKEEKLRELKFELREIKKHTPVKMTNVTTAVEKLKIMWIKIQPQAKFVTFDTDKMPDSFPPYNGPPQPPMVA